MVSAILLLFITLFIVVVYHILFITGQLKKVQRKVNMIYTRISQHLSHINHKYNNYGNQTSRRLPLQDANDSFYESCHNYREPMLGSY